MHVSPDRIGFAAVIGNGGGVERLGGLAVIADPHRQDGLRDNAFGPLLLHDLDDRVGAFACGGKRRRHVHHQHGVVLGIVD